MSLFKLASQSETPFFKTVPKRCMLISQGRPAGVQLVGPRPLHPARVSLRCRCLRAATLLRPRAAAARALLTPVSVRCSLAVQSPSGVQLFAAPWTVTRQAPLSVGLSRQESWNGLPCPPPGGLPNPGVEPVSLTSSAPVGGFFTLGATWEASDKYDTELYIKKRKINIVY